MRLYKMNYTNKKELINNIEYDLKRMCNFGKVENEGLKFSCQSKTEVKEGSGMTTTYKEIINKVISLSTIKHVNKQLKHVFSELYYNDSKLILEVLSIGVLDNKPCFKITTRFI